MVDVPRREDRLVDALSEQYQRRDAALTIARQHPDCPGCRLVELTLTPAPR
jgi:hypothetical protein